MTPAAFEHRTPRHTRVIVRVTPAERRELERLARRQKTTLSAVLRDGLAHVRRLHDDAECVVGSE
jgi:hypothetical protein